MSDPTRETTKGAISPTKSRRPVSVRPFAKALKFARSLRLKSIRQWLDYVAGNRPDLPPLPQDIPKWPHNTPSYRGLFAGYPHWLGYVARNKRGSFLPFDEARAFVAALKLKSRAEWLSYLKGNRSDLPPLPVGIPRLPQHARAYRGHFKGFVHWLGLPPGPRNGTPSWRFAKAHAFARGLKLHHREEWVAYVAGKRPDLPPLPAGVPTHPECIRAYKGYFKGYYHWLGVPFEMRKWRLVNRPVREFEAARAFVAGLKLGSQKEWMDYVDGKLPDLPPLPQDIPKWPHNTHSYRGLFAGYPHWLGYVAKNGTGWRPFIEARSFARSLGLASAEDWTAYCSGARPELPPLPADIPKDPGDCTAYKGQFSGFSDWLGFVPLGHERHIQPRPFKEARAFARSLGLKSRNDWLRYVGGHRPDLVQRPADIPRSPETCKAYRGAFSTFANWLGYRGSSNSNRGWRRRPFERALEFVHPLRLQSAKEWVSYAYGHRPDLPKLPNDIPKDPVSCRAYAPHWQGMRHWLGLPPRIARNDEFRLARRFVRSLGLKNRREFEAYLRGERPDLPSYPEGMVKSPQGAFAKHGWINWADFLGSASTRIRTAQKTYDEARLFVSALGIRSQAEYRAWARGERSDLPPRPATLSITPWAYYKHRGWKGMRHFFGG